MTSAAFIVDYAGPSTSIQDGGRYGLMRFGVPASGPMDRFSFAMAHAMIGNAAESPAIETSLGGLTLRCVEGTVAFAVAGGCFIVEIDGAPIGSWVVSHIRAGSSLAIKPGLWGTWGYIVFAGTLLAKSWLGSQSTHWPSGLGGGKLVVGQRIEIRDTEVRNERAGDFPIPNVARPAGRISVVLGPQDRFFAHTTVESFLNQPFVLTGQYDRMGVRLKGPQLQIESSLDMPSEALARGSIQVPGHGDPIVLLADHQTTGGYPKIATIVSVDQDAFAQLRPRETVTFKSVSVAEARDISKTRGLTAKTCLRMFSERRATLTERLLNVDLIGSIVDPSLPS